MYREKKKYASLCVMWGGPYICGGGHSSGPGYCKESNFCRWPVSRALSIFFYFIFHHGTTMVAETEQFTTVIMVLPAADDLVDYFSLENKPSFLYLCIHMYYGNWYVVHIF